MRLSEARAKVILFKSKALAIGKHPVVLLVTCKRTRRYYTLPNLKADVISWNEDFGRFNDAKVYMKGNKEINLWEGKQILHSRL